MELGPEEKFLRFSQLSENSALKPFAHFCVQPAAPGLIIKLNRVNYYAYCERKIRRNPQFVGCYKEDVQVHLK